MTRMAQELLKLEVHVILLYTGELYRQKLLSEVRGKEKMNESKNSIMHQLKVGIKFTVLLRNMFPLFFSKKDSLILIFKGSDLF